MKFTENERARHKARDELIPSWITERLNALPSLGLVQDEIPGWLGRRILALEVNEAIRINMMIPTAKERAESRHLGFVATTIERAAELMGMSGMKLGENMDEPASRQSIQWTKAAGGSAVVVLESRHVAIVNKNGETLTEGVMP